MSGAFTAAQQERQSQPPQPFGNYAAAPPAIPREPFCSQCQLSFDSSISLQVHQRYHHEPLMNPWQAKTPPENNNNTCKSAGADKVSGVPAECLDGVKSKDMTQMQGQCAPHPSYNNFIYSDNYYMDGDGYLMGHHFSPPNEEHAANGAYPPGQRGSYLPAYQYGPNSVSSTSPRSPLHCDKCGAVYDDELMLAEHARTSHPTSPNNMYLGQQAGYQGTMPSPQQNNYPAALPSPHQTGYPGASPHQAAFPAPMPSPQQHQMPNQQQLQMHHSPEAASHAPQYDYAGAAIIKTEPVKHQNYSVAYPSGSPPVKIDSKPEPEEQAELLDLDSHKVQTHKFEDNLKMPNQPEMHMQMHPHHQMQSHQQQPLQTHQTHQTLQAHQAHQPHQPLQPSPVAQPPQPAPAVVPEGPRNALLDWPARSHDSVYNTMRGAHPMEQVTEQYMRTQHQMQLERLSAQTGMMQPSANPPAVANQSWKSNEARRPKTYKCSACNKWFTSSGHLKRHYNTTLHKNAVKQSNQPDPATLPISVHHHPAREAHHASAKASRRSPNRRQSPPNLNAGPSGEAARGLYHQPSSLSALNSNCPSMLFQSNGASSQPAARRSPPVGQLVAQLGSQLGRPLSSPGISAISAYSMLPDAPMLSPLHSRMDIIPHPCMDTQHISPPPQSPALTQQMHPNAMPPHVITSSMACSNSHPTTSTGSDSIDKYSPSVYGSAEYPLPGFKTLQASQKSNFFYNSNNGFYVNQSTDNSVGGLSPEDAFSPANPGPMIRGLDINNEVLKEATTCCFSLGLLTASLPDGVDENAKPAPKSRRPRKKTAEAAALAPQPEAPAPTTAVAKHRCEECRKDFNKACYLTQHNKSFHAGDRPFKCSICGKRFPSELAYQVHMGKHSGEKPFKCCYKACIKQFNHKTDLRRHWCVHTNIKPHGCGICGKRFIRKDHMLKHNMTHGKKNNYRRGHESAKFASENNENIVNNNNIHNNNNDDKPHDE